MKQYKARGVVLGTIKYGDTSLVAHILTDVAGRRSYMVQGLGSKNGKSSRGALFQPMFLVEFVGLESSRTQMDRMKDVALSTPLHSIPFDVCKSTVAMFMAEVLYRLIKEVEENSPLFEFVWQSVVELDMMKGGEHNFHLWFLVGLSRYLGFFPAGEWSEGAVFDIESGQFVGTPPRGGLFFNADNSLLLWQLMQIEPNELGSLKMSRRQRADFIESLMAYFGYHLDTFSTIKSLRILSEVF